MRGLCGVVELLGNVRLELNGCNTEQFRTQPLQNIALQNVSSELHQLWRSRGDIDTDGLEEANTSYHHTVDCASMKHDSHLGMCQSTVREQSFRTFVTP
jgi:hypothetical protein